ncbi:MAG: aldo/keto reductase [Bifidobacteriaceae bacterium]|jgi:predicted oxidoreductase|nr:aldo/keto reductase [Bifidobacteriaceae bacterium]
MKTITLQGTDIVASNIVVGLMRIEEMADQAIREMVAAGRDGGVNFFDTADCYGSTDHAAEARFAEAVRLSPAQREAIFIQTKAGIVRQDGPYFDFSTQHLLEAVNGSLAALRTDYIDVLLLHRPDALVEPDEVAAAFDQLQAQGKVRHFGVSNHTVGQIELLRRSVSQPLVANQLQLSIAHAPLIAEGVATNMETLGQSVDRGAGILDYCRLNGITVQAWSPFQQGFFGGPFIGDRERYGELNDVIDALAAKYAVPEIAIATAWITRHPAGIQVVTGTTSPERIAGAVQGSELPLTRAEWYALYRAAGYVVP